MNKKLLIVLCLFAGLAVQPCLAQQRYTEAKRDFKRAYKEAHRYDPVTHAIRFQYSQLPLMAKANFNGYTLKQFKEFINTRKGQLSYVYGDFTSTTATTGTFTAGYDMIFSSGRMFSCDLSAAFFWKTLYNGVTNQKQETKNGAIIYILPKYKYYYLSRPLLHLYGSVGLGAGLHFGFSSTVRPAFQYIPIGLEVGNKLYGICEIGLGNVYLGGSFGIGYKL